MRKRSPPSKRAPLDAGAARERALRLLARREHSAAELAFKLKLRGADEDTARAAVGGMAEAGWQSDARYAEMLVRNRIEQGYGPLRIEAELEAARVPEAVIRAALVATNCDWAQRAAEIHARRFHRQPANPADWQKQYRFLAGRGFTAEQVRSVLKGAGSDSD